LLETNVAWASAHRYPPEQPVCVYPTDRQFPDL